MPRSGLALRARSLGGGISSAKAVGLHGEHPFHLLLEADDLPAQGRLVQAVSAAVVSHGGHPPVRRKVEASTLTCCTRILAGQQSIRSRDVISRTPFDVVVLSGRVI